MMSIVHEFSLLSTCQVFVSECCSGGKLRGFDRSIEMKTLIIPQFLTPFAAPLDALMAIDARVQQRVAFEFSKVCSRVRGLIIFWHKLSQFIRLRRVTILSRLSGNVQWNGGAA
jgi:hypothetical protein